MLAILMVGITFFFLKSPDRWMATAFFLANGMFGLEGFNGSSFFQPNHGSVEHGYYTYI